MALKNLFDMVKADRYTQDGREAIIKAQEAETEDATRRTYQIGEISEATGLQKTAQGWKPPKETKFGKVKQNKEGQWGVQTKQGKGSDFLKHKSEKEASRALANYTAGYNTTERSKQDPHSDQARQVKHWDKETEKIRKQNRAEGRTAHAEAAKKGNAERQDKIEKLRERAFNKTELEGLSKGKLDNLYKSEMESKPAASKEPKLPAKPTRGMSESYIRGTQLMKPAEDESQRGEQHWARVLSGYDNTSVIEQRKQLQEKYDEFEEDIKDYDRRGLAPAVYAKRINQQNFIKGALKAIDEEMERRGMDPAPRTSVPDAAPHVLTGDCRIRIRKEKPALTGDTKIRVRK
jgi:hypothetical protein